MRKFFLLPCPPPLLSLHSLLPPPPSPRWLVVIGQLCRYGAAVIDAVSEQMLRDQPQCGGSTGGTSYGPALTTTSSGPGSTTMTGLMAGGGGSMTVPPVLPVSTSQCLELMLAFFKLRPSAGGGAKLRDSALQV